MHVTADGCVCFVAKYVLETWTGFKIDRNNLLRFLNLKSQMANVDITAYITYVCI